MSSIAPLKSSLMLVSILGFIISVFAIYPRWPPWGFTFCLMFGIFIIASMISAAYAPLDYGEDAMRNRTKRPYKAK